MSRDVSALSPTHPFPYWGPRLRIAAPFVPAVLLTYFTPIAFVMRIVSFAIGIAFFGQPLIMKGIQWLTQKVPNWKDYLELRRCVVSIYCTQVDIYHGSTDRSWVVFRPTHNSP